jgi:hypothetical protein
MNRKEQISVEEQHGAKCSVCSLRFVFIFLFFVQVAFAQDTTQKYELNDPRNPNCPCHKLQKQAEEEYAQKNKQNLPEHVEANNQNNNVVQEKVVLPLNAQQKLLSSSSSASGNVSRHRKRSVWFKKLKFRYSKKMKRTKKVRPDYSVCCKW